MTMLSPAEFEAQALAEGFDEVLQRRWAPGLVLANHEHPFAVRVLVVQGDLWLTCRGSTRHLRAGDRFELGRDEPHAERYGPEGAEIWVARNNAA